MRVHLIKKDTIEGFVRLNARSKTSFAVWLSVLKTADWDTPLDILRTFGSADILGNGSNRVVFNVGGNNYRVICSMVLVKSKYTSSFVGLERMQTMISFVIKGSSTR